MGGRASTSTNSKNEPKDLLVELQRLREQRTRLRAELNSKEQKLQSKDVAETQPAHRSKGAHADMQIVSGDEHPFFRPVSRLQTLMAAVSQLMVSKCSLKLPPTSQDLSRL